MTSARSDAEELDAADEIAGLIGEFVVADTELIYLDGNSLGRLPRVTAGRLRAAVEGEWGEGLVRSWDHWIELPTQVGDALGEHLLGAAAGQVAVSDSTSVNLYKLAAAALDARPGRRAVVTDEANFPTDRYVLEGLAAQRGLELRLVAGEPGGSRWTADLAAAVDTDTALVSLSQVDYRSGALLDLPAVTEQVHRAGALTLWDLCHSAGAVPVGLDAAGVDLAVGCTYKYLNAGPGAPAFVYVRADLQDELRQPIWGWFGQRDQFAMGARYEPVAGIGRFLVGTPSVLGLHAVAAGVDLLARAGIERLRAKGVQLTDFLIALTDEVLDPLGFELASPRRASRRGSHVAVRHPDAYRICRAAIEHAKVVADFRAPDLLRLGPAPINTRFVDVWDAVHRIRRLVLSGVHEEYDRTPGRVT